MSDFLSFDDLNIDEESDFVFNGLNEPEDKSTEQSTEDNEEVNLDDNKVEDILPKDDNKKAEEELVNTSPPNDSNDSSAVLVFAKMLQEEGVLPLDDEGINSIKDVKDLKEQVSQAINKYIEEKKYEGLNESQKRFLGAVEAGVPQDEFEKLERDLSTLESLTTDVLKQDSKARFNVIAMSYISKGISKEQAIKIANASFQMQTDIEDAEEAKQVLYDDLNKKYQDKIESKKQEHKLSVEKLKETIDSTDTVLGSLKLSPKMKDDIYKSMITKVDSDESGNPLNALDKWIKENPIDSKLILHALKVATNDFKELGRLGDVAKNKAISTLEDRLRQSESLQYGNSLKLGGLDLDINV